MRRLTAEEFINRAVAVHGNRYDYSKVQYKDMATPVTIICQKHGPFQQIPNNHLRGAGCSICNKIESQQMGVNEFIRRAKEIHGDLYGYGEVVYVNSRTPVRIKCPVHGIFEQQPYRHLSGHGCPKCAPNYKDTTESFIEKARKIHGDRYDYSKVKYVDQHTKVCIIDTENGSEFWQQPNSHLNGRGNHLDRMASIQKTKREKYGDAKSEKDVYIALASLFGENDVKRDYWSLKYPFPCDFYILSLDLYIEINAHFSHSDHFFDKNNPNDLKRLAYLSEKAVDSEYYRRQISVWAQRDVEKYKTAVSNNLNYLVFWDANLKDFYEWFNNFDPINPVLKNI